MIAKFNISLDCEPSLDPKTSGKIRKYARTTREDNIRTIDLTEAQARLVYNRTVQFLREQTGVNYGKD